jgi:LCP family protein required for cell wall assembly
MRTTLKRGYGRAVEADGNGRPVLPPAVPSPMTRYVSAGPSRRSGWRTAAAILGWFVIAVLVLAAGLGGGVYLWVHDSIAATAPHTLDVKKATKFLRVPLPGKPATALVIGYDHRAGEEKGSPSRSDTIMLLRADPQEKTVSMLSFPRDLLTTIYCPGHTPYQDRINAAYSVCGSTGTLETVRHLTGVDINYLITVNFIGFRQVVDSLGGVWMDIDRRYYNKNIGTVDTAFSNIDLQPGYQKLGGTQALEFVRFRHTDSDLFRVVRQQAFVKAAKIQLARFSYFKIPKLVSAITRNTEIAQAGGKGVSFNTLKSYGLLLQGLPSGHFFQPQIQGLQDTGFLNAELAGTPEQIQAAVNDFLNPDVAAPTNATNSALGRKPKKPKTIPASQIAIAPLNGNGVQGSATAAASALQKLGYKIVVPPNGNAPSYDYFRSKVYFDPAQGGVKRAAQQVANLFGSADVDKLPLSLDALANGAPYTVIVGQTFHGSLAPAPVDRTPKRQPPYVTVNPAETLSTLRAVKKRVPFRLENPAVLERTSTLDNGLGEVPLRVYQLKKGYRAVRLTYRCSCTDGTQYWGVEETQWADAPILQGANTAFTRKGRHFKLYYSGAKLHMVVLVENGTTYWVVNTLLDSLSNETMLAIAEGLHPVPR